ncbi:MAG: glycosyltransferase family 4 protein [Ardenticatenaceae bacterium]|nr:glycosyltransferase family 4 protein [Ardenticatenaceae bacterium]
MSESRTDCIALISSDVVGSSMAGPGIRVWEFAQELSQQFPVKLIIPPLIAASASQEKPDSPFEFYVCHTQDELRRAVQSCGVIITRGIVLTAYPFLGELGIPLVLDMYNTFLLEGLQQIADAEDWRRVTTYERDLATMKTQLNTADFILCASEKQRDYWLGVLSAIGRVNPYTHQQDHSLRQLIDVVPFGLPPETPHQTKSVLKGVYKNIAANDRVILWGGGIWNWLDAETLIRAVHLISQQRNDVKLFFMGVKRPYQAIAKFDAVEQAMQLSQTLGLTNRYVFFNDWVPYNERQNYLLEADIGVSLHLDHIETRFAFRTRLLDYLWCGLPTVASKGDVLAELLASHGLAKLVTPADTDGVAQAILELLDTPNLRAELAEEFQQIARQFQWDQILQPLIAFCQKPHLAADKQTSQFVSHSQPRSLVGKSWQVWQLGGLGALWQEVQSYWRWKRRQG